MLVVPAVVAALGARAAWRAALRQRAAASPLLPPVEPARPHLGLSGEVPPPRRW